MPFVANSLFKCGTALRRHEAKRIAPVVEADLVGGSGLKNVDASRSEILNWDRKPGDGCGDYGELANPVSVIFGVT